MNYKNKYEQALKKARIWKDKSGMPKDKQGILDDIFPELKEGEDEKIRKALIQLVNKSHEQGGYALHKDDAEEMIAYLEKQIEHANFRNKIQIGDKVTRNMDGVLVNLSQLNRVAKIEEKQGEQKPTDEEMKTLLQTEYEKGRADAISEMQKSWSEEDENRINRLIAYFEDKESFTAEDDVEYANWLKSLKDRHTWKPSGEQIEILDMILTDEAMDDNIARLLRELKEQLKKLKG